MTLTETLAKKRAAAAINIPSDKYAVMQNSTRELEATKLAEDASKTGQQLPSFELANALGERVRSGDLLKKGPLVVSFYRGGWCPYCNMELRALQQVLDQIHARGAALVAISPETPDHSLSTSEKNELSFEVLSDINNQYAKELGLVFQMPEDLREVYHSFNLDIPKHNGNLDYELPMPATYVVDSSGEIIFHFVPADYTQRLDPEEILKVLAVETIA